MGLAWVIEFRDSVGKEVVPLFILLEIKQR